MRHDLIAGSADCRSLGRGQKQSLARSDLVPAGDVVVSANFGVADER